MKIHVVVTGDDGTVFEGETELVAVSRSRPRRTATRGGHQSAQSDNLDFTLPTRAFIKRYARGLSGARKFTVLLAALAGGKAGVEVSFKEIQKTWNRMTEPLGGKFNPAHTTRAKDKGWVDTPKTGFYILRPSWAEALKKKTTKKKK